MAQASPSTLCSFSTTPSARDGSTMVTYTASRAHLNLKLLLLGSCGRPQPSEAVAIAVLGDELENLGALIYGLTRDAVAHCVLQGQARQEGFAQQDCDKVQASRALLSRPGWAKQASIAGQVDMPVPVLGPSGTLRDQTAAWPLPQQQADHTAGCDWSHVCRRQAIVKPLERMAGHLAMGSLLTMLSTHSV